MISRRSFLKLGGLGALGAAGSASLFGLAVTTESFALEEQTIHIPALPRHFEDYRIGFLSDIHYGTSFAPEWLDHVVDLMRQARPDILLLGGDYIWIPESTISFFFPVDRNPPLAELSVPDRIMTVFEEVGNALQRIPATDGTWGVFGNHDRWVAPQKCRQIFAKYGIRMLVNQLTKVERAGHTLSIYGTDDHWTGFPDWRGLPPKRGRDEARLVLSHNPDFLSMSLRMRNVDFDLGLSGHTHGGQVVIPGLGAITYNIEDTRLESGLFQTEHKQLYTTRGIGVVEVPFRINCPPEITLLTLKSA